jgi:RNA-directed DNA polymerase
VKRGGNLIKKISDVENIELAFYKAAKSKWHKSEVIHFSNNLERKVIELQSLLIQGKLSQARYCFFDIYDPKKRTIAVAPFEHRVAHHAIMNICDRYFDNKQIYHSYACRKGKGSALAVDYVKKNICSSLWYLKLDVKKYFDSIPHQQLKFNLRSVFKDELLLRLFGEIIDNYHSTTENKGIPIGNLTSQYFANHYLVKLDRLIKEELKVKYYVRYMDDMLLFNLSKAGALRIEKVIKEFIFSELSLTLKISQINRIYLGIPFLGYRIFKQTIKLGRVSKARFVKRSNQIGKALEHHMILDKDAAVRMRALLAFAERADIRALKKKINLVAGSSF